MIRLPLSRKLSVPEAPQDGLAADQRAVAAGPGVEPHRVQRAAKSLRSMVTLPPAQIRSLPLNRTRSATIT